MTNFFIIFCVKLIEGVLKGGVLIEFGFFINTENKKIR